MKSNTTIKVKVKSLFGGYRAAGLTSEELMTLNLSDDERFLLTINFVKKRAESIFSSNAHHHGWANILPIAGKIVKLCKHAEQSLLKGSNIKAMNIGFNIGEAVSKITLLLQTKELLDTYVEIEEFRPDLERGIKVITGNIKGGETTRKNHAKNRPDYQAFIDQRYKKNPNQSYEDLKKAAAAKYGCSERTIGRHTENPKK